jgi:hypothetical protein
MLMPGMILRPLSSSANAQSPSAANDKNAPVNVKHCAKMIGAGPFKYAHPDDDQSQRLRNEWVEQNTTK